MFTIAKRFSFSASHQLTNLPPEHPCSRLHGHNYEIELVLRAEHTDLTGFVYDYRSLDRFKVWIDDTLDHRHLNDVFGAMCATTAENIAEAVYVWWEKEFPALYAVRVSETPKTWAEYSETEPRARELFADMKRAAQQVARERTGDALRD